MSRSVPFTKIARGQSGGKFSPPRLDTVAGLECLHRLKAACAVLLERTGDLELVNEFFFDMLPQVFEAMTIEAQDVFRPKIIELLTDECDRLIVEFGSQLGSAELDPAAPLTPVRSALARIKTLQHQIDVLRADQAAGERRERARKDQARKAAARSYVNLKVIMHNAPRNARIWRTSRLVSTGVASTRNRDRASYLPRTHLWLSQW